MLTKRQFSLLTTLLGATNPTQRLLAKKMHCSLGTVNNVLSQLCASGFVDNMTVTEGGIRALAPYKVENAVIMAAGMSKRLVPLSLEKPKGLLVVRGEVLIERQIRQLQEAGIKKIFVVVGYLKEQFFYLEEKYGITLIVNSDYYRYDNTSTLMLVAHKISNTYICSSDNYYTENTFSQYEYTAYYSSIYFTQPNNDYELICARDGRIKKIDPKGGINIWGMRGHAYFDRNFASKFVDILSEEYKLPSTREHFWEDVLVRHINELCMYIRKYNCSVIHEFDSLDDLRLFDSSYINSVSSQIFINICSCMHCEQHEITGFTPINEGLTNMSFRFKLRGAWYVYREPGKGTNSYINRHAELQSLKIAHELGLDKTFIFMSETGWKISHYRHNARHLNFNDPDDVKKAMKLIRELHKKNIKTEYTFDPWEKIIKFIETLKMNKKCLYEEFNELFDIMNYIKTLLNNDNGEITLCHCDAYDKNFLIHDDGIDLIDWEYSGTCDTAVDIGSFIASAKGYTYEDTLKTLVFYFGRELTPQELKHFIGYIALTCYYWYIWGLFQECRGNSVGEYMHVWWKAAKLYSEKAKQLYGV